MKRNEFLSWSAAAILGTTYVGLRMFGPEIERTNPNKIVDIDTSTLSKSDFINLMSENSLIHTSSIETVQKIFSLLEQIEQSNSDNPGDFKKLNHETRSFISGQNDIRVWRNDHEWATVYPFANEVLEKVRLVLENLEKEDKEKEKILERITYHQKLFRLHLN